MKGNLLFFGGFFRGQKLAEALPDVYLAHTGLDAPSASCTGDGLVVIDKIIEFAGESILKTV
jgi:hypothetical protein